MSPKELAYIEDALNHSKVMITQCRNAAQQLSDPALRMQAQDMIEKHQHIYDEFMKLM
jgi:hypothetical protein